MHPVVDGLDWTRGQLCQQRARPSQENENLECQAGKLSNLAEVRHHHQAKNSHAAGGFIMPFTLRLPPASLAPTIRPMFS